MPVRSFADFFRPRHLRSLASADLVIVSGVNPWVLALAAAVARLKGIVVIADAHGSAYYESWFLGRGLAMRILFYLSERLGLRLSSGALAASGPLSKILEKYLKMPMEKIITLENSTNILFEHVVGELARYPPQALRERALERLGLEGLPLLILAPLPAAFASNLMAFGRLRDGAKLGEGCVAVVTGMECEPRPPVVCAGVLSYVEYSALLLASDAVVLPYPENAVCGGARNKALEALYLNKPIVSTPAGVLFTGLRPGEDYIPFDDPNAFKLIRNLHISKKHLITFKQFKLKLLESLLELLATRPGRAKTGGQRL